jgi:hypothetical protein
VRGVLRVKAQLFNYILPFELPVRKFTENLSHYSLEVLGMIGFVKLFVFSRTALSKLLVTARRYQKYRRSQQHLTL